MKKAIAIIGAILMVLMLVSCGSGPKGKDQSGRVPGNFPDFVKDALKNVPDDTLVGIGVAKLASLSQSMTVSATRARADISRQMNTMIQDMVRDYQASSEVNPEAALSFQENITVALSKAQLIGSKVVIQDQTADGNVWTVVWLGKSDVVKEINQANAAAKLAVPAMASFNAEDRMNQAFANANNGPFVANDN